MYNQRYRLTKLESNKRTQMHEEIEGNICYLAYFNVGEVGWFLCDTRAMFNPVHRIRTSIVNNVLYADNQIIVVTENSKYTFELER